MEIDFLLRQVLMDNDHYGYGVVNELADHLKIHRHSVRKLLNGEATTISMRVLGDLCDWLKEKDVPGEDLPQCLFRARPSGLWQAVAATGNVTIYLGEYQQISEDGPTRLWISRRDSGVANAIAEQLYALPAPGDKPRKIHTEYIPFRFAMEARYNRGRYFKKDIAEAKKMFRTIRSHGADVASITVGSQQVNFLLECMVADLFGCKPFVAIDGPPKVPFHMIFRHRDDMKSCFGSPHKLPGSNEDRDPGIYYRDKRDRWVACPWERGRKDAAVLVVSRDLSANAVEIAMFGFSGRATAAMETHVVLRTSEFWPPHFACRGKEIGVYICKFTLKEGPGKDPRPRFQIRDVKIVPLDPKILRKYT